MEVRKALWAERPTDAKYTMYLGGLEEQKETRETEHSIV